MTMTERWALAAKIAGILGISKSQVFNCLGELQDRGLVEPLVAGTGDIEAAKAIAAKAYGSQPSMIEVRTVKFEPPKNEFEAVANDMQLMLWTIKKIGDPVRARTAFDNVMKALEQPNATSTTRSSR